MSSHEVLHEYGYAPEPKEMFETDKETTARVRKLTDGISSSLHVLANEPSLGLYRMQEHVCRTVPELVETKRTMKKITQRIQGACHDVEYALTTVQQMHNMTSLTSIHAHAVKAIELQQRLKKMQIVARAESHQQQVLAQQQSQQSAINEIPGVFSDRLSNSPNQDAQNEQDVENPLSLSIDNDTENKLDYESFPTNLQASDKTLDVGTADAEQGSDAKVTEDVDHNVDSYEGIESALAAPAKLSSSKKKKKKKKKPQDIVQKAFD